MTSPVEIQVVTFAATTRILGRELHHCSGTSAWFSRGNAPDIQLTRHERDGTWTLEVRARGVRVATNDTTPEAAAAKWLELASLETPRLAAMIVDVMGEP